ncbi:hypothetical protein ACTGUQ_07070, partial [Streptococcus suis]
KFAPNYFQSLPNLTRRKIKKARFYGLCVRLIHANSGAKRWQLASNTIERPCLTSFFLIFVLNSPLLSKKSLDMNVYYGRIGLRNMKGVKQMNKQLVIQQAIFYHTLLSKQENKAH